MDESWYPDFSTPSGPQKTPYNNRLSTLAMVFVYSKAGIRINQLQESPVSGSSSSPRALSAWSFWVPAFQRSEETAISVENETQSAPAFFRMQDFNALCAWTIVQRPVQDARTATALQWLKRWSLQCRYLMAFLLFPLGPQSGQWPLWLKSFNLWQQQSNII